MHYTTTRWPRLITANGGQNLELLDYQWECKWYNYFGNKSWQFIIKLNRHLLYDPQRLLLDIYPREMKKDSHSIALISFLVRAKELEAAQVFINRRISCCIFTEWNITRQYQGTIPDARNDMDLSHKHYSE